MEAAPTSSYGFPFTSLPAAPEFTPTWEEFLDPIAYIEKIRPIAEKAGICKIIPPASYREEVKKYFLSAIDQEKFQFKTKVQLINQLQCRPAPGEVFRNNTKKFLKRRGIELQPLHLGGQEVDLYRVYLEVEDRGGYQQVQKKNQWDKVLKAMSLPHDKDSALALSRWYHNMLYMYEQQQQRKRKRDEMEAIRGRPDLAEAPCEICGKVEDDANALLCDRCDHAFHIYCLTPPLDSVPAGDWICPECELDEEEFGFAEGKTYTLAAFAKLATSFERRFFKNRRPKIDEIERDYWRIVDNPNQTVEVCYMSDVDVKKTGSGFPLGGRPSSHPLLRCAWNPHLLPKARGSVLAYINDSMPGVTYPMMYVGMLFSTFCWHTEDNYLYSTNYLHSGDPKVWYGVPSYAATDFEQVMKETFPKLFNSGRNILYHLTTMLSPATLTKRGVPVYRCIQEEGHLMITFPRAYHAGFNAGHNVAESVNFAPPDWLPLGRAAVLNYRLNRRSAVFSHEMLVCTAAQRPDVTGKMAEVFRAELEAIIAMERRNREPLVRAGFAISRLPDTKEFENAQCAFCKYDCWLSAVKCSCNPNTVACIVHADDYCNCASRVVFVRYTMTELEGLRQRLIKAAERPSPSSPLPTFPFCPPAESSSSAASLGTSDSATAAATAAPAGTPMEVEPTSPSAAASPAAASSTSPPSKPASTKKTPPSSRSPPAPRAHNTRHGSIDNNPNYIAKYRAMLST